MEQPSKPKGLPENAFRVLKPGEIYEPVIPAKKSVLEVTWRSILFGLCMGVFFSAATTFIILKLGQGIETTIPIAILAVGFSALMARKSTLLENINILSVGGTAGIIAGGSVFTMPAIYILGLDEIGGSAFVMFCTIMIVPFFGAVLGALFLIPFRRYFVADMHGKLPFPEGTAIAETLMAGEKGGAQARVLAGSLVAGFVLDFVVLAFRVWSDVFNTASVKALDYMTVKVKAVFALNTSAAIAGLGYLIGVRYAAIILAGSILSTIVVVPLVAYIGGGLSAPTMAHLPLISDMSADDIFSEYARYMGIGGIFVAGLVGILKLSKVIVSAFTEGARGVLKSKRGEQAAVLRTERDISMPVVLGLFVLTAVLLWIYFRFVVVAGMENPTLIATIALAVTVVISFLFVSVSAWAVAMISVTPISGMTLMTLIVSSVIMMSVGLEGKAGMLAVLLIGGVVCTALSMAATLVTELKLGYWMGATPKRIQWSNILACIVAAVVVTAVMLLLNDVYGFTKTAAHPNPLPAPQPNAMAAVLSSLMGGQETPWLLYALGGMIALIVEMLGISALAFALGMYLPIELNSPILIGAIVAWLVKKSSKNEALSKVRHSRGLLVASGLLAGGALAGVMDALVKYISQQAFGASEDALYVNFGANAESMLNWIGLLAFFLICGYMYWNSCRAKEDEH